MTQPRSQLISPETTPYYHLVSRCVRRAFLCGDDQATGKCYEHRRQWIVNRIRLLSSLFAIDICSYAVMSNHYHLVVKLNSSADWSQAEVIKRWLVLHKGPLLIQRWAAGQSASKAELDTIADMTAVWRERLQSLSWFMKCLNEPIAREANKEDGCRGHFWESRFKSQALLSDEALLSCMAYVDLNPIRAAMADTPEHSDYTSIQERIAPQFDLAEAIKTQNLTIDPHQRVDLPLTPLLHFDDSIREQAQSGIPFSLSDYLQLVDWTGRAVRAKKRGAIPGHLPPILQRLGIPADDWLTNSQDFEKMVHRRFKQSA